MIEIVEIRGRWLMEEVAKLYSEIFREAPWNENFTQAEAMEIMVEQFNRPQALAIAALIDEKVRGFTWVYEIFQSDLKENTRHPLALSFLFKGGKRVFYFQEVGVKTDFRRQGIGERLTQEILERAKNLDADVMVLSTNREALPALQMFSRLGFRDSGIVRPPKELGRTYWILRLT